MPFIESAYDTVACAGQPMRMVNDKLKQTLYSDGFHTLKIDLENEGLTCRLHLVRGGNAAADEVPFFHHPMQMPSKNGQSTDYALDVRAFGRWHAPSSQFMVRNMAEYDWAIKRAVLNFLWGSNRVTMLRDVSTLPARVYATLIAETIARRFNLDPREQLTVAVIAAYFYFGLFTTDSKLEENDFNRMVTMINRATLVDAQTIYNILDGLPVIDNLMGLCQTIRDKVGNLALENLNVGTLIAVVAGTWIGTNSRENLAVGLEHVPTWLMIVFASTSEATFKRSLLAKLTARFDRGSVGDNFVKAMNTLFVGVDDRRTELMS